MSVNFSTHISQDSLTERIRVNQENKTINKKGGNNPAPANPPELGRVGEPGMCTTRGTGRGWAYVASGNLCGPCREVVLDAPQVCPNLCGKA